MAGVGRTSAAPRSVIVGGAGVAGSATGRPLAARPLTGGRPAASRAFAALR